MKTAKELEPHICALSISEFQVLEFIVRSEAQLRQKLAAEEILALLKQQCASRGIGIDSVLASLGSPRSNGGEQNGGPTGPKQKCPPRYGRVGRWSFTTSPSQNRA